MQCVGQLTTGTAGGPPALSATARIALPLIPIALTGNKISCILCNLSSYSLGERSSVLPSTISLHSRRKWA
jgi:hypothetical protein